MKSKIVIVNCEESTFSRLGFNIPNFEEMKKRFEAHGFTLKFGSETSENVFIYGNTESCNEYVIKHLIVQGIGPSQSIKIPKILKKPFKILLNVTKYDAEKYSQGNTLNVEPAIIYSENGIEIIKFPDIPPKNQPPKNTNILGNNELSRLQNKIEDASTLWNYFLANGSLLGSWE